jgi:signal transduction histidine kinase
VNGLLVKAERYGVLTDPQKHGLERILRNTKRAQSVLSEILDVCRCEEHLFKREFFFLKSVLKESLLNVSELLNEGMAERVRDAGSESEERDVLEENGIFVAISGRYEEKPFFHDRRKIQLILENLVSNALKYRRKRMDISISGEENLVILVSDDGPGIPKDEQEAIYKRFMRLKSNNVKPIQGLGLGLFCVKMMVETMNGQITLASREGSGTAFTVQIPPLKSTEKEVYNG